MDAVELEGVDLSDDELRWRADFDPVRVRLLSVHVVGGPPLWYVEDGASLANDAPEMALIAFQSHHFPPGFVVSNDEFEGMPVHPGEQVGAVKWWVQNGQMHEVYVQPERRRTGVGGALGHAAAAHQIVHGGPPVWVSGERTDLGEACALSIGNAHRVAPRTRWMPPMTPPNRQVGVADRNLYPDPGSMQPLEARGLSG